MGVSLILVSINNFCAKVIKGPTCENLNKDEDPWKPEFYLDVTYHLRALNKDQENLHFKELLLLAANARTWINACGNYDKSPAIWKFNCSFGISCSERKTSLFFKKKTLWLHSIVYLKNGTGIFKVWQWMIVNSIYPLLSRFCL